MSCARSLAVTEYFREGACKPFSDVKSITSSVKRIQCELPTRSVGALLAFVQPWSYIRRCHLSEHDAKILENLRSHLHFKLTRKCFDLRLRNYLQLMFEGISSRAANLRECAKHFIRFCLQVMFFLARQMYETLFGGQQLLIAAAGMLWK